MSREEFPKRKLKGVNVPDTLVTVNDADSYKLLDAPNIDWDEYLMKWTNIIYKFKSGGNVAQEEGEDNNKNDWYTPEGSFNNGEKPSWSNGIIKDSEQVLDMIDYLMYRVANLDYFCDNWNLRDSAKTSLLFCCYNPQFISPTSHRNYFGESNFKNNYLKINTTGNTLQVLLKVSPSDINYTLLKSTGYDEMSNDYKTLFGTIGPLDDTEFYILSNSRGKLSIVNESSGVGGSVDATAHIVPPVDLSNVQFYEELPNTLNGPTATENDYEHFYNPLSLKIYGTSAWFYGLEEISQLILQNPQSFTDITNGNNLDSYKIDPNSATFSFSIKQNACKVAGIQYGEMIQPITLNVKKNNVSSSFSLIVNGNTVNSEFTSIPFYNEILENNKYKLTFNVETNIFGITNTNYKQYGLYPTFFIKNTSSDDSAIGSGTFTPFTSDGFNKFTNDFGTITYENGDYYYEPPREEGFPYQIPIEGYQITIYCLLYYKNGTGSTGVHSRLRSFEPIFIKANVKLKSKEKNKIIFLANTTTRRNAYRWNSTTKSYIISVLNIDQNTNGTSIYLDNQKVYYADDDSTIDYAVKDMYFDKTKYHFQNGAIYINNVKTNIASSIWSDDIKIEFYGVANQTSLNSNYRQFNLTDPTNYLCVNNETGQQKQVVKERFYKLGEDASGNNIYFDYVNDISPEDYTLDISNNLLIKDPNAAVNDERYLDTSKLNSNALNTVYKALSTGSNTVQEYGINNSNVKFSVTNNSTIQLKTTTALFPDKNGLVSNNDNLAITNGKIKITNTQSGDNINYNGTIYDADNDYYYLVFRVYCPAGSEPNGGITYSACEAYYFLRVLRNTKPYSLVFNGSNEVSYSVNIGNNNTANYSMKLIARSPIYLNRLLSNESIAQNADIKGKQYWYFYGSNKNESTSNTWNDNVIAIDNGYDYIDSSNPNNVVERHKDATEKYLYIYNDGDTLPVITTNYSDLMGPSNPNYILSQNNWYYDVHGSAFKNVKVSQITDNDETTTGSVLFIDKLMRLIDTSSIIENPGDNINNNTHFTSVSNNSVNINLGVIIGNSDLYTRTKSSTIGSLTISKRNYDINLYKVEYVVSQNVYTEVTSSNSSPIILPKYSNSNIPINSINSLNLVNFTLASDEFSDRNKNLTAMDNIKVLQSGKLVLPNSDINTSIRFESGNTTTWWINSGLSGVTVDSTKDVNVYHFKSQDDMSNNFYWGLFYFVGVNTTSVPYMIKMTISPDEEGIYAEKIISNYFTVQNS